MSKTDPPFHLAPVRHAPGGVAVRSVFDLASSRTFLEIEDGVRIRLTPEEAAWLIPYLAAYAGESPISS